MNSTCAATVRWLRVLALATGLPIVAATSPAAAGAAPAPDVAVPANALLSIDQNRSTVVERVVATWGDALAGSGAGLTKEQLGALLTALRADQLLAASLAGSLDGLRNVIANALTANAPVAKGLLEAKALGDATDDLVYTPVTPCREVDTRNAGGPIGGGSARDFKVWVSAGGFTAQGGAAGNCNIPANPVAVVLNIAAVSPAGAGNFIAYPTGTPTTTSVLNYQSGQLALSNGTIALVCQPSCTNQLTLAANGAGADAVIDIVGYFKPPGGAVVSGSGTVNALAKWTPNGATLGNSAIVEAGGMVGIGTSPPAYTLDLVGPNAQINLRNGVSNATALISRYTNRLEISPSDALQISVGGIAVPHVWVGANGNVGIGNTAPVNHLQIGATPSFSGNDFALGNGTKAMSFLQSNTASTWFSSANFSLMPNTGSGFVGIGTQAPASRLQIGSVGLTGYGGHDIAFGNGTQASGILQTGSVAQWYSTTDIALMPQGNGNGHVGINITAPYVPLEVYNFVTTGAGFSYFRRDGLSPVISDCFNCQGTVSIYASHNVMALEFDATSDARIKDVVGTSDSAKDLDTINVLQITDYTLKDKVMHGNQPFKKVIAQQVETVYPQVVSKHVDFIPNVYRAAASVTKTADGTLLHFDAAHGLSGQAKRLKLLASGDNTMQKVGIVATPSATDVVVDLAQVNGDRVFVYGEEVDDFRTVDYEGLTALNISATQELSKQLASQQAAIANLVEDRDAQLADLRRQLARQTTRMAELEQDRRVQLARIGALEQQAAEMAMLRQQVARMAQLQELAARVDVAAGR